MSEQARIWQRVSTGGQDEASQLPDQVKWCDSHGYTYSLDQRYLVHGKSAYHGKHAAALDRAMADMAAGEYTVLVVWAADRIERRGALAALTLAEQARQAGGRIEYVKDSHLNSSNDMSDVMLSLAATMARQESQRKSERVIAKHTALRAAGSAVGRAPWGYAIVERDGKKIYAPTDDGRNYVPTIFQMIIDGASLRDVAAYMTAAGVPTTAGNETWHEAYLGNRLIRNPVYYGQRVNGGQLETKALVSYSVWQQANAAVAARRRPGRSTVRLEKALLSPVCGNPDCDATGVHPSPMYRVFAGTGKNRAPYYRCTGRGPQRKGCGLMVPVAELDDIVTEEMLSDRMNPHTEREFVAGDDRSDEIGKLRERAMEAYRAGDRQRFAELDQEATSMEAMPAIRPHWIERETNLSRGEYFESLDPAGRRAEIAARYVVTAYKSDGQAGALIVPAEIVAS